MTGADNAIVALRTSRDLTGRDEEIEILARNHDGWTFQRVDGRRGGQFIDCRSGGYHFVATCFAEVGPGIEAREKELRGERTVTTLTGLR